MVGQVRQLQRFLPPWRVDSGRSYERKARGPGSASPTTPRTAASASIGELVIETPFTLTDPSGHQAFLTPTTGSSLAPILGLFARVVTDTEVTGQGALSLGFDDGTRLSDEPDPDYESWNLTGSGIDPVLVGPGGETDWHH
ncbi:DUF6188 family protein [Streptomyces sp. CG 926]|uniref:DUF6188 family protein n=1 Tax=Streptomyces sp. CG 926 TaxID=1882405 RepID=UPI00215A54D7|nr:DUF6188 family protein [Streptomyces sp. CG 926]